LPHVFRKLPEKKQKGAVTPEASECGNCSTPEGQSDVTLKPYARCKLTRSCLPGDALEVGTQAVLFDAREARATGVSGTTNCAANARELGRVKCGCMCMDRRPGIVPSFWSLPASVAIACAPFRGQHLPHVVRRGIAVVRHRASMPHVPRGGAAEAR
jgi:hypothetical protein